MKNSGKPAPCPRCNSTNLVTERCESGTHYGKLLCTGCRRFRGWAPAPMTPERAGLIEMPFGKFAGASLALIAETVRGREYLAWLIDQDLLNSRLRRAVQVILAAGSGNTRERESGARPKRGRG